MMRRLLYASKPTTITPDVNVRLSCCSFLAASMTPPGSFYRRYSASLTIFCRRTCHGRGASMAAREHIWIYRSISETTLLIHNGLLWPRGPACCLQSAPRFRNVNITSPDTRRPRFYDLLRPTPWTIPPPENRLVRSRNLKTKKTIKRYNILSNIKR